MTTAIDRFIHVARDGLQSISEHGLTHEDLRVVLEEVHMMRLIQVLRADEGDSVDALCDNPESFGPANAVECCGAWTEWLDTRFSGETLREALEAAVAAKAEAATQ
jgi:uncharacterized protein YjaG (DUF416 family)